MTRVNDDVSAVVDAVSLSVRYRVAVVVFFIHSYLLVFLCVCVYVVCSAAYRYPTPPFESYLFIIIAYSFIRQRARHLHAP